MRPSREGAAKNLPGFATRTHRSPFTDWTSNKTFDRCEQYTICIGILRQWEDSTTGGNKYHQQKHPFLNSKAARIGLAALLGCAASPAAMAALVCTSPALDVPATIDGIYLNLVTGATGSSGTATPGQDFNAYANSAGLNFFIPAGGAMVGAGTVTTVLATSAQTPRS